MRMQEDYLTLRAEQGEVTAFADGFGGKAILAALFVAFVVTPGSMFMWLMLGQQLGTPAVWVTLIVFLEIAKRCRTQLTRQEMFVIWSVTWGVLGAATMTGGASFIWMQYFVRSDAAAQFEIANQIPFWTAPPPGSEAYVMRDLLHHDWWAALALVAFFILWGRLSYLSLGYAMFRLTSDLERLPFPISTINARGVTALAESEQQTWRWRCFSIGSTIGAAFGAIYIAVPVLTGVFLKKELYLIQVPFYDFSTQIQGIPWFRAVPLAIWTDMGAVFWGFVLPFWSVVGGFLAGVVGRLILNPILYRAGVLTMWQPGMNYIEADLANQFDFWLSFGIGTAVAVALLGFYTAARQVAALRHERRGGRPGAVFATPPGRGDIPVAIALLFYVAGTSWLILIAHWLVPKFPVWILLGFGFAYTPIMSYVSARLYGLTGSSVGIPYVREAAFVLSGYRGVDVWVAPVPLADMGTGAGHFREIELTGTKFTSIFKAHLFVIPLAIGVSVLFWAFFYRVSQVPEDYPFAMRYWPRDATLTAFWMTATTTGNTFFMKAVRWPFIGAGATYGLVLYPVLRALGAPTLFVYGMIQGVVGDPAMGFPLLAGALLGRYYMRKALGAKEWPQYAPVLAAGFACGMGLVGMGAVAVRLIARAVTMVPF